jgi:protoheme IX farnesyltransferase
VFDRVAPADLLALTKPRITLLVVLTVAAGFVLAMPLSSGAWTMSTWRLFLHALFGAAMVAAGTNALNQVMERDVDALMLRTSRRPLPSGRLGVRDATVFAWGLGVLGVGYLALFVNVTTSLVAAATLLSYVLVYTPLKRRTPVSTLIGVIPGALPIVGGWTGAGGELVSRIWLLFAILCMWQIPHFLALSWMYRDDYARAGIRMLSVVEPDGHSTFRQAVLTAAALIPVSLAPSVFGMAGGIYFVGAALLSGALLAISVAAARNQSIKRARRLFLASLVYLPGVLTLMIVNRTS